MLMYEYILLLNVYMSAQPCPKSEDKKQLEQYVIKSQTYVYRSIRSSCDRLSFCAEIQIIFGTVCTE